MVDFRVLRVFISSRDKLLDERKTAEKTIYNMGLQPILGDVKSQPPSANNKEWLKLVSASDVTILIIADEDSTYVKEEIETCISEGKSVLVLRKNREIDTDEQLEKFLEEMYQYAFVSDFTTCTELADKVWEGILIELSKKYREKGEIIVGSVRMFKKAVELIRSAKKQLFLIVRTPPYLIPPNPLDSQDEIFKNVMEEWVQNKIEKSYLFSTDTELEDDLNNETISGKLNEMFKRKIGITLSKSADVKKNEDNNWEITDKKKNHDYIYEIKKEDDTLEIYEKWSFHRTQRAMIIPEARFFYVLPAMKEKIEEDKKNDLLKTTVENLKKYKKIELDSGGRFKITSIEQNVSPLVIADEKICYYSPIHGREGFGIYIRDSNIADGLIRYIESHYVNYYKSEDKLKGELMSIGDHSKAIELDPSGATAYYIRGVAYDVSKQYERAIEDYNKAIELNPSIAVIYTNRGNAFKGLGQYERAIDDYNKAIKRNPNDTEAYENRELALSI
jgi:tetratricopeptide (TPR) repeat protein